jgi:hypothetical protein
MVSTNSFAQNLICPVCQTQKPLTDESLLCDHCGWTFMIFTTAVPEALKDALQKKAATQKKFRDSVADLQKKNQITPSSSAELEETFKIKKNVVQTLKTQQNLLEQTLSSVQQQVTTMVDHTPAIEKLEKFLENQPIIHSMPIKQYEIWCSYKAGFIYVEYPKHLSRHELPTLVLGIALKQDFQLVIHAEMIYLVPPLATFTTKQSITANMILLEQKFDLPPNRDHIYKLFGCYVTTQQLFFNVITKK